jgi:hypothetical protein
MDDQNATSRLGRVWWENISERISLARWLIDEGRIADTSTAALEVVEKPARYTREYTDYCAAMTVERTALLLRRAA